FIDTVPNDEIDTLKKHSDYSVMPQLGTYYVSFNVKKAPMDNPLVRKALTLAIDRDFIVTNIGKSGQLPAGAFVPPALTDADPTKSFRDAKPFYYDPSFEAYEANLAEAKKLLAEAGYPEGKGFPAIEYLYNAGTGHQLIGEAMQSMWKELGITVNLVSQEWNTFLDSRKKGDYFIA
ncbi:MAG: ABC transporter substrate-binding protein, partial [Angelakisella sp.]